MSTSTPWRLVRTMIVSYLITAVLLLILTFLLYRFRLPEAQVNGGIYVIYIVSCLIGGFLAGKSMKTRRFLWGLLAGVLYFAILYAVSMLQDTSVASDASRLLTVLGFCAASGMIGGMVS